MSEENKYSGMTEDQILQKLLDVENVPERTVVLERIGIPVKLKAITGKQLYRIREEHTNRSTRKGVASEKLDAEGFNVGLIVAATVSPNFGDPKLLAKYQASEAAEVLKRMLLAGELDQLADHVLSVSGFDTDLEEIKN